MAGYEFPGEKNTNGYKKFRFSCPDTECAGHASFFASMEEAPEYVPSGIPCPFGGDHESTWIIPGAPAVHIRGTTSTGHENPYYSRVRANAEHDWMEMQIKEARAAVNAEDQMKGTAASPYGKYTLNHEEALRRGMIKKASQSQTEERNRIMEERSKIVCDQASDKLTDIEKRHAGRRHDG
tara:strand:+ start:251 stop:793 length:543 start_codon:yes stop_codon:yes gene_type:complete